MKKVFIRSIGNVRFNGIGADLYENKDKTACICFDKLTHDLPGYLDLQFKSLIDAELFIECKKGSNGLNTLINILNVSNVNY